MMTWEFSKYRHPSPRVCQEYTYHVKTSPLVMVVAVRVPSERS